MPNHARNEFSSINGDPIFSEELVDYQEVLVHDEDASDHKDVPDKVADADVEDEELLLLGHGDDGEAKDSPGEHASGEVRCPECGKCFKNDKSMFGHLRSHPNRGYKGATPPVKKLMCNSNGVLPASSPPVDDRSMNRLNQRDDTLPAGEPPGKLPSTATSLPPANDAQILSAGSLSAREIIAAFVMLTLRYRGDEEAQRAAPPSLSPSCSTRKHGTVEHAETGIEGSAMNDAGAEGNRVAFRDQHGSSAVAEVPGKRGRKKSKDVTKAHTKKEKDVKEKRPYVCKHCKAEFVTYQALGGHMAGHNKDKRNQTQNERAAGEACQGKVDQIQNGQEAGGGDQRRLDDMSPLSRGLHEEHACNGEVCHGGWRSGQAPGGHMRQQFEMRHLGSPPQVPTADGDRRTPLNIDLNLDIDLNVEAPEQE